MKKFLALFAAISITFSLQNGLSAQELSGESLRAYRLRQVLEAFQEKIHTANAIPEMKNEERESVLATGEEKVSSSPPESEVHAAINPTNDSNLVVADMRLIDSLSIPIYYSSNLGKTWNKSTFHPNPNAPATNNGGGDPVFAYDANGKLYMTWIDTWPGTLTDSSGWFIDTSFAGMYWASSTDGGKTWLTQMNNPVGTGLIKDRIDSALLFSQFKDSVVIDYSSGLDDKEWIAVDRSHSSYRNTLYVTWTHLGTENFGVKLRRKLPNEDTLEAPVQVSSPDFKAVQYTSIGIDSNGGVHVTFMGSYDTLNYGIYTAYSSDGGKTFSSAVKISDVDLPFLSEDARTDSIFGLRHPGNYPCPHLSIDTAGTGNLYEVWDGFGTTQNGNQGANIYFSRSTDNGSTWSPASVINNDLDTESNYIDHFYPTIAVDGKGKISICWYDRREDPFDQIGRYYIGQSTDQGNTWTNMPVASQPMDFNYVGNQNGLFGIGEYTQVLAAPNYTIPVWTDGRDDAGNIRIYAAFLSNLASKVEELSTVSEGVSLSDAYPNPLSTTTTISFHIVSSSHASLYVTNIAGMRIRTIYSGMAEAGDHNFVFDGSQLANGIYYLDLETDLGVVRRAITILH